MKILQKFKKNGKKYKKIWLKKFKEIQVFVFLNKMKILENIKKLLNYLSLLKMMRIYMEIYSGLNPWEIIILVINKKEKYYYKMKCSNKDLIVVDFKLCSSIIQTYSGKM